MLTSYTDAILSMLNDEIEVHRENCVSVNYPIQMVPLERAKVSILIQVEEQIVKLHDIFIKDESEV